MATNLAVIGAQWGDEGKGKIVDYYTESAQVVVRYAGGPNAGHTLVVGDDKLVVRLLPSGILRPTTKCILGQGMVIDAKVLLGEIDQLTERGFGDLGSRLMLSDRAHMIFPYHLTIDALRETALGQSKAIGTTKKGIGPAYEDKARRTGIRAGDLADLNRLTELIEAALEAWRPTLKALGGDSPSARAIVDELAPLLDIDHGTYPFVTSSSAVAGGATIGAGIGPSRIDCVVGITKAYTTRVGSGPFPTEQDDAAGKHLRDVGVEFGSVTGRPRRTGWLDLPALRYARRVNGLDGLALTKLDVLTGLDRVRICVAYDTPAGRVDELPIDLIDRPGLATPVYRDFDGWTEPLSGARRLDDLPPAARRYLDFLESGAEVPLYLVSVGPRRAETIELRHPFAGN